MLPDNEIALLTNTDGQADETTRLLIRPLMAAAERTIFPRKERAGGSPLSHQRRSPRLALSLFRGGGRLLQPGVGGGGGGVGWSVVSPRLPKNGGRPVSSRAPSAPHLPRQAPDKDI